MDQQRDLSEYLASRRTPPDARASTTMWVAAAASFVAYIGINYFFGIGRGKSGAELVGSILGLSLWPFVAVALSHVSRSNRNQRTRVKVFFLTSLALFVLGLATLIVVRAYTSLH